jgi:hypothetical protein
MLFVADLSPRRAGFDRGPVYVGYVVVKVTTRKVFLQVLTFSFVNIISPMFHNNFHLNRAVISETNGQRLRNTEPHIRATIDREICPLKFHFFSFSRFGRTKLTSLATFTNNFVLQ